MLKQADADGVLGVRLRVRFSPSPKPYCHLGLARTALLLDLLRRRGAGDLLIRVDDLVGARAADLGAEAPLIRGLRSLGIEWDHDPWGSGCLGTLSQSARLDVYRQALDRLVLRGFAYGCECAPRSLRTRPCTCFERQLSPAHRAVLRFRVDRCATTQLRDLARGELRLANAALPDPVLIRRDGRPTYYLAYPADDAALGVTLPVFERSVQTTQLYAQVREALGCPVPMTAHVGKLLGCAPTVNVERLLGSAAVFDLESYLAAGVPPSDVVLMLLHSLFGTWRGPYPDDLDEVAFACPWRALKHVDMHLPIGVLKAAVRARARCETSGQRGKRRRTPVADGGRTSDAVRCALLISYGGAKARREATWLERRFESWLGRVLALAAAPCRHGAQESTRAPELIQQVIGSTKILSDEAAVGRYVDAAGSLMDLTAAICTSMGGRPYKDETEAMAVRRLCRLLVPLAPATAEEAWRLSGRTTRVQEEPWPRVDVVPPPRSRVQLLVQVNSKKVAAVNVPDGTPEDEIIAMAMALDAVASRLNGAPRRVIVVPDRMINIVS